MLSPSYRLVLLSFAYFIYTFKFLSTEAMLYLLLKGPHLLDFFSFNVTFHFK